MFALIDCNNFYVSCERLFRPDLHNKPVIVLSNNDGCVISRSNEAKALGIVMGEPYFKIRSFCQEQTVHLFSSNYTLYGDISNRVMHTIAAAWPTVEFYSIDEAFLDLSKLPEQLHDEFCQALQKTILRTTGIPTSIGIGRTKTLAKIANYLCKKKLQLPVYNIDHQDDWLNQIAVNEVWGIGRKLHQHLLAMGIYTAKDLASADKRLLKNTFSVEVMRTALELSGVICKELTTEEAKQSIMSSKSFSSLQTDLTALEQAISTYVAAACEKLRSQGTRAQSITVFVRTNKHRHDLAQYNQAIEFKLINPTDDVRYLTTAAKYCLKKIYKPGFHYVKVGVLLNHLLEKRYQQFDLFNQPAKEVLQKDERLLQSMEAINHKFGRATIRLAAEGYYKPWAMKQNLKSPAYTTNWLELAHVFCK